MSEDLAEKAKAYFDEWAFGKNISGCYCSDAVEYAITRDREERDTLAAKLERLVMWCYDNSDKIDMAVHIQYTGDQKKYQVMDIDANNNEYTCFGSLGETLEAAVDAALKEVTD